MKSKMQKRQEAEERAEARAARTDEEQFRLLEARGKKGCREWMLLTLRDTMRSE